MRPDLLGTRVAFIAALLAWCAAAFQLAFEQVTQQLEKPLTIGLGQSLPPAEDLSGIGWGEPCWVRDWTWDTALLMR